ncbi:uncharacterized protein Z518_09623 [Rhinocladiella mackenziei CBS 650.93]|uniref:Uncharacterized protein n=1 Tax=Rhinocladiella mackenziei CBS 650.93 TaxID=1442369 RepID=A0A0D2GQK0_9EURO|nr:uncharacterized protein Z518_09623 [Rhinocladiella mackenziei CBS 650.93]KIX00558.1 hypothetical protein Z518_09623 [Rhinocladiella mackenziei CBS 650.93]
MQPFYVLSDRCLDRERELDVKDYNQLLTPQKLWYGIIHRHMAMTSSAFAAICAPFLTIIASGLFSPGAAISQQTGIIAQTTAWFNTSDTHAPYGGSFNNSDPPMITRIMYSNAGFPQWTYSELALAEVGFEAGVTGNITRTHNAASVPSQLAIEVPALRVVMNCTTRPYTSAAPAPIVSSFQSSAPTFLEVNMTFPEAATEGDNFQQGSPRWNYANGALTTQWAYNNKPGIVGYWTPAFFGDAPWPTTMSLFAEVDANGNPKNITILTCMPYIETVRANAVFNLPSFELAAPATAIESAAKYFNNDSFWAMTPFSIAGGTFDQVLIPVNLTKPSPLSASDSFFQALFQSHAVSWVRQTPENSLMQSDTYIE